MTPTEISNLLRLRHISQKALGEEAGVSQTTVALVIASKRRNQEVRRLISKKVRIPIRRLWPAKGNNHSGKKSITRSVTLQTKSKASVNEKEAA